MNMPTDEQLLFLPIMERPEWFKDAVLCPVCKGRGQWLWRVGSDTYCACSQCNSWGYVKQGSVNETCVPHEMKHVANTGNCLNVWECTKCGKREEIDSSG